MTEQLSTGGLLCVGETMALMTSRTVGTLAQAPELTVSVGGAEGNVAIGARRLGVRTTWAGRLGADSFGDRVERELRAEGVLTWITRDHAAPTGVMVKERRTVGTSRVWYYRDGSAGGRLAPEDVPADLIASADLVHLTGITPGLSPSALAAVRSIVAVATAARTPISFDVNHRTAVWADRDPGPVYRELVAAAAIMFAGEDEARLAVGIDQTDRERLLGALAALTDGDVVLKLGADGCLARIGGDELEQDAVPVEVRDTVGAGDAFVAGYLAELLAGATPDQRLRTAVRCGAFACLTDGDWEGNPTRAELALLDTKEPVVR